jgi:plastocyanin
MRRLALVLCLALLGAAPAAEAHAKPAKVCHWVKATKQHKRHKVCSAKHSKKSAAVKTPAAPPLSPPPATTSAPADTPTGDTAAPVTAPAPPAAAAPPARLQVTAREWSLTLSRATLPAGSVIAELVNRGEDGHDLHIRPAAGGADVLALPETASLDVLDSDATAIPAGTYTIYCSLPGHEAAGMHATLTVG